MGLASVPCMAGAGTPQLPDVPEDGTVSAWVGPIGGAPIWTRDEDTDHSAASTIKVLVLVAYLQAVASGRLNPDELVVVHGDFASAHGRSRFQMDEARDDDRVPWTRGEAPLRWLAERMITHSSNLATDLVIERVGLSAVTEVGNAVDGVHVRRPIDDQPAQAAGLTNTVTAAGLATVFALLWQGALLAPAETTTALALLSANSWNDEIPAGLPPRTPVAHKNGWDDGIRHDAGMVLPGGKPPFIVTVLTTGLTDEVAQPLIADVAAWAWSRLG
jgi:beta-lactamase class A